jgi:lipooligosaccharide transport system permease protein
MPGTGALGVRALEYWLVCYRRTWRGSVVSGVLAPVLYLGSLGFGLGQLVDSGSSGGVGGVAYVLFVAPGVLAANAMQTAVFEASYPVWAAVKWNRQYHAMLATPLGVLDVLLGHLLSIILRVAVGAAVFLGVAAALGAFGSWWVLLALPVVLLCGAAHAAPMMAFSARQETEGGFPLVQRFLVIPMFLLAGTFFPVEQLPAALHAVAWVTPLWQATTLCRDLALGTAELLPALGRVGYLLLWTATGLWQAARAYRRRLAT